jgi:hypothetical protein
MDTLQRNKAALKKRYSNRLGLLEHQRLLANAAKAKQKTANPELLRLNTALLDRTDIVIPESAALQRFYAGVSAQTLNMRLNALHINKDELEALVCPACQNTDVKANFSAATNHFYIDCSECFQAGHGSFFSIALEQFQLLDDEVYSEYEGTHTPLATDGYLYNKPKGLGRPWSEEQETLMNERRAAGIMRRLQNHSEEPEQIQQLDDEVE